MSNSYDLHTHSTASDGTLSPADLLERAAAAGLSVLALTDHDTLAGMPEAQQQAAALNIQLIAGVEISVTWNAGTVHIVGLGVDPTDKVMDRGLSLLRDYRGRRALEIGRRLQRDAGVADAFAGASRYARGDLIGRTHFAHYLVEIGKAKDLRAVFKHYLVSGKPGHVAGDWATLEQALDWINGAGGLAVVAHPARYRLTRSKLRRLFGEFKELGGKALEVVSGSHSKDDCLSMARHAKDFGLLASVGSDYHGPESPWLELGRLPDLPPLCRPIWNDWPDRVAA